METRAPRVTPFGGVGLAAPPLSPELQRQALGRAASRAAVRLVGHLHRALQLALALEDPARGAVGLDGDLVRPGGADAAPDVGHGEPLAAEVPGPHQHRDTARSGNPDRERRAPRPRGDRTPRDGEHVARDRRRRLGRRRGGTGERAWAWARTGAWTWTWAGPLVPAHRVHTRARDRQDRGGHGGVVSREQDRLAAVGDDRGPVVLDRAGLRLLRRVVAVGVGVVVEHQAVGQRADGEALR